MQSNKRLPTSLPSSPTKSPFRRYANSVTPSSPTKKKNLTRNKKITKSQSETGLVSSFRKFSITPNPQPPPRSKSTSPRKITSDRVRGLNTASVSSVGDIACLIKESKCKNIIVMAGAGISTPSGIPDFRTPGTGLYDNLQQYNIPEPTAIFDIEYFWYDPRPFFCLARTLYPGNFQPNYVHHFVKLLNDNGVLLRMYTQNIDGLERLAGLPADKLVEAHGTFSSASCIRCHRSHDGERIREIIMSGEVPRCRMPKCKGVVKPDIVFFGEDLPKRFFSYASDFPKCDLLLIMGTSLEVEPFAGIVHEVTHSTPRLLINRETVGPFVHPWRRRPNDVVLKGDIVTGVKRLAKLLEWSDKLDTIVTEADKEWEDNKRKTSVGDSPVDLAKNIETKRTETVALPSNGNGLFGTRSYHTLTGISAAKAATKEQFHSTPTTVDNRTNMNGNSLLYHTLPGNGTKPTIPGNHKESSQSSTTRPKPLYNGDFSNTCNTGYIPRKDSLFSSNSVARRVPLLPFRYTHRANPEIVAGDFKSIDMSRDLASAGIGLGGIKNKGSLRCFLSHLSDSDSTCSTGSGS